MRTLGAILLCSVPLLATGCVAPLLVEMLKDPLGREAALTDAHRRYTNALRWGEVERAVGLVHPDLREDFSEAVEAFRSIRVTDYEVGDVEWDEDDGSATFRVTYRAYSLADMLEKEIREVQKWQRIDAGNTWLVRPEIDGIIDQVAQAR